MGTIPEELKNFKSKVSPSIGSMSSTVSILSSKISSIMSGNTEAMNKLDASYKSENKGTVLSSVTSLNTFYKSVESAVSSELGKILTDSQTLIDKVTKLEKINEEIKRQEEIISNENSKENPSSSVISSARSAISSKNSEFETVVSEANSLLASMKSMSVSLPTAS